MLTYPTTLSSLLHKTNNMCRIPNCYSSNGAGIITSLRAGKLSDYSSIQVQRKIFSFSKKISSVVLESPVDTEHSTLTNKMARV
jgi:hypothetical protein